MAEDKGNVLLYRLVPLFLAHSKLLAFSVPASDSFICATGIKRTSRMSGMGEAAGDLVPLQEMQAL